MAYRQASPAHCIKGRVSVTTCLCISHPEVFEGVARLRPMRGLQRQRSAQTVSAGCVREEPSRRLLRDRYRCVSGSNNRPFVSRLCGPAAFVDEAAEDWMPIDSCDVRFFRDRHRLRWMQSLSAMWPLGL